jgi:hypothetical protein
MDMHTRAHMDELVGRIETALHDVRYLRIHQEEFDKSTLNLIKELKALEEKHEIEKPKWPAFYAELRIVRDRRRKKKVKQKAKKVPLT